MVAPFSLLLLPCGHTSGGLMARLRVNEKILFSVDTNGISKIYSRNFDVNSVDEITDDFTEGNSRSFMLAKNTAISAELAGVSPVKFVRVESDLAIVVTLNGGSDIPLTPRLDAAVTGAYLPGRMMLWTDGITSIGLRNASTTVDANVTMVLGG